MGQILSCIFHWLWGDRDDKKKPSARQPLISPGEIDDEKKPTVIYPPRSDLFTHFSSSRPALQPGPIASPSLGTCRDQSWQTNLRTHPPPPHAPSSTSFTHSKASAASCFQPTTQPHDQLNLTIIGLSTTTASSPVPPIPDTLQQLRSSSCSQPSATQFPPKPLQSHQPLNLNSCGLSKPSVTSQAQPKTQTHPSTQFPPKPLQSHQPLNLNSCGLSKHSVTSQAQPKTQTHPSLHSSGTGASHFQPNPVTLPRPSVPIPNSSINGVSPRNAPGFPLSLVPCGNSSSDDDELDLFVPPVKFKIAVESDEKKVSEWHQQYDRIEDKETTRGVGGKNLCGYRSCEEDDLEKGKLSIEVRWINHYSSEHKILLVGEGDFSFSASLAMAFRSAANITATSLDSIEVLKANYKLALSNIDVLLSSGAKVMHGVDATKMANVFPFNCMCFDRVVFNFPLAGFFPNEARDDEIWRHRMLVQRFLENAKKMIHTNGEIHITHKSNGFFYDWNLGLQASSVGLRLIEEVPFNFRDYPGYHTKYGFGGDNNFDCNPSKTYKFGHKKPLEKGRCRYMR